MNAKINFHKRESKTKDFLFLTFMRFYINLIYQDAKYNAGNVQLAMHSTQL